MIIVWIFLETAINIGYSCQLLTDEMNDIFIVDAYSFDDVRNFILFVFSLYLITWTILLR